MATHVQKVVKKKPEFYRAVYSTPLVEIFAVTVEGNNDDLLKDRCEIYGHISVTDELVDFTFDIYRRDKDNPEYISFSKELLLTPPLNFENAAIIPSEHVKVDVLLYDRARRDMVIVAGKITLDSTSNEDWLEDYQAKQIAPSVNKWNAIVHYAIFPYAVTATVRVLFFSNDDHFDLLKYDDDGDWRFESSNDAPDGNSYENNCCQTTANLFGKVSAFAAVHGNDGKNPFRSSLLFRKSNEEYVKVKSGKFIQMSRSVVAVPSYSSLKITADFSYGDTQLPIASGTVEFRPNDYFTYKNDIVGDNGSRIRVQVAWSDASDELYRPEKLRVREGPFSPKHSSSADALSADYTLSEDNFSKTSETLSDNCTLSEEIFSETSETLNDNCILPPGPYIRSLMEIFSIVVCSKDATPLKFYGSVVVADGYQYLVFRIKKSRPQDCPNSGMLAIVGDGCANRSFDMDVDSAILVDFKDVSGDIVSKGCILASGIYFRHCFGKRMYKVVRGERGFAAVHYSVFPDAVSAAVKITLANKNCAGVIKGKICARHVSCDQSSRSYQENLFKSILFCDENGGAFLYTPGVALPLVKSVIALPRYSYLIIEADVSISPDDDDNLGKDVKSVKGSVIFTGNGKSPKKICDDLHVFVKFFEAV